MKEKTRFLLYIYLFFIFSIAPSGKLLGFFQEFDETEETSLLSIGKLMENKNIKNCEKAIKGYESLLKKTPDDPEILYKIANAYICMIDIKTSALIEEKNEFKPVLDKLGKIAYGYAYKAYKINPKCKEAVGASLVAYGYYSASFGILKAVLKGAAGHYKDLANQLIQIDEKYDGALGYRSLAKLYHVAPWPVGSTRKALKFFKKAVETDNAVLYSHYYLGLIYFEKDEFDLAKKEFTCVMDRPPDISEIHFIETYKNEARKFLQKIARKKK
jgi:tetratricopeptide (TPR) repeat protein